LCSFATLTFGRSASSRLPLRAFAAPFVGCAIAVVVQTVAHLIGRRYAATVTPYAIHTCLLTHRALTDVRAAGARLASCTRAAFINRLIAVVVETIANFRSRLDLANAVAPLACVADFAALPTYSDVASATTLEILISKSIAIVI
jgi:hypothetical protein